MSPPWVVTWAGQVTLSRGARFPLRSPACYSREWLPATPDARTASRHDILARLTSDPGHQTDELTASIGAAAAETCRHIDAVGALLESKLARVNCRVVALSARIPSRRRRATARAASALAVAPARDRRPRRPRAPPQPQPPRAALALTREPLPRQQGRARPLERGGRVLEE